MPNQTTKNDNRTSAVLVAPIPPAYGEAFTNGIAHPRLLLWDSWCYSDGNEWHLYCLALANQDVDGQRIYPKDRNKYQFHLRHFKSADKGQTWYDLGVFQTPSQTQNGYDSRNIWSGSALRLTDGRMIFGFTGIREITSERPFLQSLGIASSADGLNAQHIQAEPISCPLRDYDLITSKGYFLGPKESLGHKDGEGGGPILAWRDPYLFLDENGALQMVWSAKTSPTQGAMAHASLVETKNGFEIETLHPPIYFPDGELFTQAEVPKIYQDPTAGDYICVLAACDRLYEGQDDDDVSKLTRLYRSKSIGGPWLTYGADGSLVENLPEVFGGSIIEVDFDAKELTMLAPYTEMAPEPLRLTFAAPIKIPY